MYILQCKLPENTIEQKVKLRFKNQECLVCGKNGQSHSRRISAQVFSQAIRKGGQSPPPRISAQVFPQGIRKGWAFAPTRLVILVFSPVFVRVGSHTHQGLVYRSSLRVHSNVHIVSRMPTLSWGLLVQGTYCTCEWSAHVKLPVIIFDSPGIWASSFTQASL